MEDVVDVVDHVRGKMALAQAIDTGAQLNGFLSGLGKGGRFYQRGAAFVKLAKLGKIPSIPALLEGNFTATWTWHSTSVKKLTALETLTLEAFDALEGALKQVIRTGIHGALETGLKAAKVQQPGAELDGMTTNKACKSYVFICFCADAANQGYLEELKKTVSMASPSPARTVPGTRSSPPCLRRLMSRHSARRAATSWCVRGTWMLSR